MKSPVYKLYGDDWQVIQERIWYYKDIDDYEKLLIHRLQLIGLRLSKCDTHTKDDYILIFKDLQGKIRDEYEKRQEVGHEIGQLFEELQEKFRKRNVLNRQKSK